MFRLRFILSDLLFILLFFLRDLRFTPLLILRDLLFFLWELRFIPLFLRQDLRLIIPVSSLTFGRRRENPHPTAYSNKNNQLLMLLLRNKSNHLLGQKGSWGPLCSRLIKNPSTNQPPEPLHPKVLGRQLTLGGLGMED